MKKVLITSAFVLISSLFSIQLHAQNAEQEYSYSDLAYLSGYSLLGYPCRFELEKFTSNRPNLPTIISVSFFTDDPIDRDFVGAKGLVNKKISIRSGAPNANPSYTFSEEGDLFKIVMRQSYFFSQAIVSALIWNKGHDWLYFKSSKKFRVVCH